MFHLIFTVHRFDNVEQIFRTTVSAVSRDSVTREALLIAHALTSAYNSPVSFKIRKSRR